MIDFPWTSLLPEPDWTYSTPGAGKKTHTSHPTKYLTRSIWFGRNKIFFGAWRKRSTFMDDPKGHWTSEKSPWDHVLFSFKGSQENYTVQICDFKRWRSPHWWYFNILHSRIPGYERLFSSRVLLCFFRKTFISSSPSCLIQLPPISLARMILSSGQTNHIRHKPQVTRGLWAFFRVCKVFERLWWMNKCDCSYYFVSGSFFSR